MHGQQNKKEDILLSRNRPGLVWAHPASWLRGSFPGNKTAGVSSLPLKPEVVNEWNSSSMPCTCLHGVDRDNFTFCFYSTCPKSTTKHILGLIKLWQGSGKHRVEQHLTEPLKGPEKWDRAQHLNCEK